MALDRHRHGASQQSDREDHALFFGIAQEDAFHSCQRTLLETDSLTNVYEAPRLGHQARLDRGLNGGDFRIVDRYGNFSDSNKVKSAGDSQQRKPAAEVQPAEHVPGEERKFHRFQAVGPPLPASIQGQELFETFMLRDRGNDLLATRLHAKREPLFLMIVGVFDVHYFPAALLRKLPPFESQNPLR
jgi:hypothetical protein